MHTHLDQCARGYNLTLDGERRIAVGWACLGRISQRQEPKTKFLKKPRFGERGFFSYSGSILPSSLYFRLINISGHLTSAFGEVREGEGRCGNHVAQGIQEQVGVLATIESEAHLFEVSL